MAGKRRVYVDRIVWQVSSKVACTRLTIIGEKATTSHVAGALLGGSYGAQKQGMLQLTLDVWRCGSRV